MGVRGPRTSRCITCKQRKVKCDETRPGCLRCQRDGVSCLGYNNQTIFVNLTKEDNPPAQKAIVRRTPRVRQTTSYTGTIRSLLPSEEDASVAYLLHNFSPTTQAIAPGASLLPQVLAADQLRQTPMHKACLAAVATSYFGKTTRNKTLFEKGQRLYSVALRGLAQGLTKPGQVDDSGMVRAILCLSLYENVNLSNPMAWCHHYGGLSKLIYARGPEYYKSGPNRDLLLVCRLMIILHAGMLRIPCFLALPSWRAVAAGSSHGQDSRSVDFLLSMLAEVPGISYAFDHLGITHESTELRDKVRLFLRALQTWHLNNKEDGADSPQTDKGFALILHHAILLSLSDVCSALHISLTPLSRTDDVTKEGDLAVEMINMADVLLQKETSTALAILLIFPLQKASRLIVPGTDEAKRVDHILNDIIATTCGLELGRKTDWPDQEDS